MRLSTPFVLAASLALAACETPDPQVPQGYPGQPPPQGYAPGQPPQGYAPPAYPPVEHDPINDVDLPWLRAAAKGVLDELTAALPPAAQARVQGIPFVPDATTEVNAYAACDGQHKPLMAITDGLLQIEAYVAQVEAIDEVFGTQKLDAYLRYVAQNQQPHQPIVAPPASFIEPAQHADYRKVVREHQLFEEQLAFVLGHELGHHHLGHTGCAVGQNGAPTLIGVVTEVGRLGNKVLPFTNMPNESWADIAGVNNLLTAGARRGDRYHWTEGGALLTLKFFAQLAEMHRVDPLSPEALLYAFEQSHPQPAARVPGVKQAAAEWRARGGVAAYPPALP